jgi:peptidoglycan/xylan/chitin deacetylase (PgdA/CDA1 family)
MSRAGMTLGAHGRAHRYFSSLEPFEQRRELEVARNVIEQETATRVQAVSLPGGRFDSHTFSVAHDCGYRAVFTSAPVPAVRQDEIWRVGRVAVRRHWTAEFLRDFLENQDSRLATMRRRDKLRRRAQGCFGDRVYGWAQRFYWWLRRA